MEFFTERVKRIVIVTLGETIAILTMWFMISNKMHNVQTPSFLQDAFGKTSQNKVETKATASRITPFPNETDISTYPAISATFTNPISRQANVFIRPNVDFEPVISKDTTTVSIALKQPLKPNSHYTVTITDTLTKLSYSWSFTTSKSKIDQKLLPAIDRVRQQLPYTDPNGRFQIYLASQTDTYFISIHNDERSSTDQSEALAWLKQQGVADTGSLHIVWLPSEGL